MPLNEKYNGEIHVSCPGCQEGLVDLRHTVDEDWLEKKMRCFLKRCCLINERHNENWMQANCFVPECPFCFPQEQPKPDHIPDVSKMVEDVREKVVFDEVYKDIASMVGDIKNIWYLHGKNGEGDPIEMAKPLWDELKQKIEYLVSLQEKV